MRVALTGGATGIGAEVVSKLKLQGHHVTAFDISEPNSEVDRWVQIDLSDQRSIQAAIETVEGPFDALINNAGLPPRAGLEELILKVNYFGLKAFLDGMIPKLAPGSAIVNTASRAGAMWRQNLEEVKALMAINLESVPNFIEERKIDSTRAYNLSKEAVIVLTMAETENMIARNIRMSSVSPAAVSTGILDDFVAAFGEKVAKNIERVGRPGLPTEIADVILFLISKESNWLKGTDIVIDGGMGAIAQTEMLELNRYSG